MSPIKSNHGIVNGAYFTNLLNDRDLKMLNRYFAFFSSLSTLTELV